MYMFFMSYNVSICHIFSHNSGLAHVGNIRVNTWLTQVSKHFYTHGSQFPRYGLVMYGNNMVVNLRVHGMRIFQKSRF